MFVKAYENADKSTFGNLQMPHDNFYNYIYNLESVFIDNFPILSLEVGVGDKLKMRLFNIIYEHPCLYFNKDYLLKFFIRFRIYVSIKFLNRNLVSEKIIKNRKLAILQHL